MKLYLKLFAFLGILSLSAHAEWLTFRVNLARGADHSYRLIEIWTQSGTVPNGPAGQPLQTQADWPTRIGLPGSTNYVLSTATFTGFSGGVYDPLGGWHPAPTSYGIVAAERTQSGAFALLDETTGEIAPVNITDASSAAWHSTIASSERDVRFAIPEDRAGHPLLLAVRDEYGTLSYAPLNIGPVLGSYTQDESGESHFSSYRFFQAWGSIPVGWSFWLVDLSTQNDSPVGQEMLLGQAWGTSLSSVLVNARVLLPASDAGRAFTVRSDLTGYIGVLNAVDRGDGYSELAFIHPDLGSFSVIRHADSAMTTATVNLAASGSGTSEAEIWTILSYFEWVPLTTYSFSIADSLNPSGWTVISNETGNPIPIDFPLTYSEFYDYRLDGIYRSLNQNCSITVADRGISFNDLFTLFDATNNPVSGFQFDDWQLWWSYGNTTSVNFVVPESRFVNGLVTTTYVNGEATGVLVSPNGDAYTDSLTNTILGAQTFTAQFRSVTANFPINEPQWVADSTTLEGVMLDGAASSDAAKLWFPTSSLQLKISLTRVFNNLQVRTAAGATYPVTVGQIQGIWSISTSGNSPWFTNYGVFDAGSQFQGGEVPWYLYDATRNQYLSAASGNPTDFSASVDSTDSDQDGVPDWYERLVGLNPFSADSDGDGMNDGDEYTNGTNPNAAPVALVANATLKVFTPLE